MEFPNPAGNAPALPASGPAAPPPRRLAAGEGAAWWGESWRIFCAAPGAWIGIFVIFVVLSIVLVMIPLIGSLVHTVLIPILAGGATVENPGTNFDTPTEKKPHRSKMPSVCRTQVSGDSEMRQRNRSTG